eukprot:2723244-Rhodomonas_salina.2
MDIAGPILAIESYNLQYGYVHRGAGIGQQEERFPQRHSDFQQVPLPSSLCHGESSVPAVSWARISRHVTGEFSANVLI